MGGIPVLEERERESEREKIERERVRTPQKIDQEMERERERERDRECKMGENRCAFYDISLIPPPPTHTHRLITGLEIDQRNILRSVLLLNDLV